MIVKAVILLVFSDNLDIIFISVFTLNEVLNNSETYTLLNLFILILKND